MSRLLLLLLVSGCAPKDLTTDPNDRPPSFADLQASGLRAIEQAPPSQDGEILIENATVWTLAHPIPLAGFTLAKARLSPLVQVKHQKYREPVVSISRAPG
jgi:hypothetical protein